MDKIREFHQKIDEFFIDKSKKYSEQIQCKLKCDKCCHVELSIFEIEKSNILDWYSRLDVSQKKELIKKLETPQIKSEDLFGNLVNPCVFLYESECSIYPVRPTLCRSQGLPMLRIEEDENQIDCCPLNFIEADMEINDCLSTDTVNLVLSSINLEIDKTGNRTSLKDIRDMILSYDK